MRRASLIIQRVARVLGGSPRFLTEDELEKLAPQAQEQLLDVIDRLEQEARRPSPSQVMKLIAQGRIR
jgi:uncharacterized hydantoinase/oxoprolinase family protein